MKRFYYSRSYTCLATSGRRRRFFFTLLYRSGDKVGFLINDKGNDDPIHAVLSREGDTEISKFKYMDRDFCLRADDYISKGYPFSEEGMEEREEDKLRDAYIGTMRNREELEQSKTCVCLSCRRFFGPEEIEAYTDNDETGICPYCGVDALLGNASEVKMEDLVALNKKYFNYDMDEVDYSAYLDDDDDNEADDDFESDIEDNA